MARAIMDAVMVLALPTAVLLGGGWAMVHAVGREEVTRQLDEKAAAKDRKPLNQRLKGYESADVGRHWDALDPNALAIEERFLELDLVFPVLYGAALAAALLMAWTMLGRPFHPGWLILPVAITIVADWIENLVQLSQLHLYLVKGGPALQAVWVQVASTATVLKLAFLITSLLLVVGLSGWMVVRAVHPSS